MKFKKIMAALAITMIPMMVVESAMAGFGRGSSSGVSRSYNRPATSSSSYKSSSFSSSSRSSASQKSYTAPRSVAPSYTPTYRSQPQPSYNSNRYNQQQNYNYQPRQRSTMGDIGVTAAGVAGGVLAAHAITALIASPGHPGMYTHPQYPGQYFNSQGVPQIVPAPQQMQQPQYVDPGYAQQAPVDQYQQQFQPKKEKSVLGVLFGFLFDVIGFIIFGAILAGIAFGVWRLFGKGKKMIVDKKSDDGMEKHRIHLGIKAQDLFYGIQANSNNKEYLSKHTKYLPLDEMMDEPSEVVQFEQGAIDVESESGKIRGSVYYRAKLKKIDNTVETIREYWNFELEDGIWKLIGIDQPA